jgi:hypothetical protein
LLELEEKAQDRKPKTFERRGREGYAKGAKKKQPNFWFFFCALCDAFASSAFKKLFFL